ncbi:MAG TPA: hypothetical protein VGK67_02670 [Myxococcales bacterium]|jgi:hypothetical protein
MAPRGTAVGTSDAGVRSSTCLRLALLLVALDATGCLATGAIGLAGKVIGGGIAAAQRQDYSVADDGVPPPSPESCPDRPTACVAGRVVAFENRGVGWHQGYEACEYGDRIVEDCGAGYCDPSTLRCLHPCDGLARPGPDSCSVDGLAVVTRVWVAEGPTADGCRLEARSVPCGSGGCNPATAACGPLLPGASTGVGAPGEVR